MQALSARIPDLAHNVLFFISTPPHRSATLRIGFRKPVLNITFQETLKLCCEPRRFGIQTPGSSPPSAACKVLERFL